jgi:hypothetical protein
VRFTFLKAASLRHQSCVQPYLWYPNSSHHVADRSRTGISRDVDWPFTIECMFASLSMCFRESMIASFKRPAPCLLSTKAMTPHLFYGLLHGLVVDQLHKPGCMHKETRFGVRARVLSTRSTITRECTHPKPFGWPSRVLITSDLPAVVSKGRRCVF